MRVSFCAGRLFHDESAAEHAHLAAEGVVTWLVGQQFDRDDFPFREHCALAEVAKDDHFGAGCRLFAAEVEPHGPAVLDHNNVGCVATLDQDHGLLVAAAGHRCAIATLTWTPEEPGYTRDQTKTKNDDQHLVGGHETA